MPTNKVSKILPYYTRAYLLSLLSIRIKIVNKYKEYKALMILNICFQHLSIVWL